MAALPSADGPRINVIVTDHPFGAENLKLHVASEQSQLLFGSDHIGEPDLELTTSYAIAKELFLDQDPEAVMTSFMAGDIRLRGDVALMIASFARRQASDEALNLLSRIVMITAQDD